MSGHVRVGALLAAAFSAAALRAQDPDLSPRWGGTKDRIQYHINSSEFSIEDNTIAYNNGGPNITGPHGRYSVGTGAFFEAQAHLPTGAVLQSFELDYCDNSVANVVLFLSDCSFLNDDCNLLGQLASSDGADGCGFVVKDISAVNYTVQNNSREVLLTAYTGGGDANTVILGAYVGYKLQVSPAPATPTFGDVPTSHLYFRAIEALAASGITSGCGGGNFCPNQPVTRGEIAKFLANALGLHWPDTSP